MDGTAKRRKKQAKATPTSKKKEEKLADPFEILWTLSEQFARGGCYLSQIKCLESICNINYLIPAQRGVVTVKLAEILLSHFENGTYDGVQHAKQRLLQAERELRGSKDTSNLEVKLQVYSLLSHCHMLEGDLVQATSICDTGINILGTIDACDIERKWMIFFLFQKLKCQVKLSQQMFRHGEDIHQQANLNLEKEGEMAIDKILQSLNAEKTNMTNEEKSALAISQAVVQMKRNNPAAADSWLTETAQELGKALRKCEYASNDTIIEYEILLSRHYLESLRGQYYLLYGVNAQLSGRSGQLQQDGKYTAFEELSNSMEKLEKMEESLVKLRGYDVKDVLNSIKYGQTPLSTTCTEILADLIQASLLRMAGKTNEASLQFAKAQEEIDLELIPFAKDGYRAVSEHGINMLQIRCISMEFGIVSALVTCDFKGAAKLCLQLIHLLNNEGKSLGIERTSSAGMTVGHYFHSTREFDTALSLFDSIYKHGPRILTNAAALNSALTELHDESRNGIILASSRLRASNLDSSHISGLPSHERALAQMINALILYKQKDSTGARLLLTKALKQAHGVVGSSQFVGQILNTLAPVQNERHDQAGALQMLESAATLLKSVKDLISLVTSFQSIQSIYIEMDKADKAKSCSEYLARKKEDLHNRLQIVYGSQEHRSMIQAVPIIKEMLSKK